MSSRAQRVNSGINSLVRRLLVDIPGEDEQSAEEREANALDFVTEVLQRCVFICVFVVLVANFSTAPKPLRWLQMSIKPLT